MNNMLVEKYKEAFRIFICKKIDFTLYDNKIFESGLSFNNSKNVKENINSKFYVLLNRFYVENLSVEDQEYLNSCEGIDDRVMDIISRTYSNVLKSQKGDYVSYGNPPVFRSKNGNLAIEIILGKANIDNDVYLEILSKQNSFIYDLNERLKQEIFEKLGLMCDVFIDKRI